MDKRKSQLTHQNKRNSRNGMDQMVVWIGQRRLAAAGEGVELGNYYCKL